MTQLKELISAGLIPANTKLRPLTSSLSCEARLTASGQITIDDNAYSDLDTAMAAALQEHPNQQLVKHFTANAWQFWASFDPQRQAWAPLEHLRAKCEYKSQRDIIRTSDTHPLRIDELAVPNGDGLLGLTFCPGKITQGLYGGKWQRNLEQDIQAIQSWQADTVITLMEAHEFAELGVPSLAEALQSLSSPWLHLPIRDMNIPDQAFLDNWQTIGPELHQQLSAGAKIVIHCRGGLGRTGLLAAQILIENGMLATKAIQQVRSARERSIETFGQEEYLLRQQG